MAAGGPGDHYITDFFIYGVSKLPFEAAEILAAMAYRDPRLIYYAPGTLTEDNKELDRGPSFRLTLEGNAELLAWLTNIDSRTQWFEIDASDLEERTKAGLHRARVGANHRMKQLATDGQVHGFFYEPV